MALLSTFVTDSPSGNRWHPYKDGTQDSNDYLTLNILSKVDNLVIRFSAPINKRSDKQLSKLV